MDFYRMMSTFMDTPALALMPGFTLLCAGLAVRSRGAAFCGVAWLVYAPYEYAMKLRWLCSGECNIRIDLLLIYPVLAVATLLGLALIVRRVVRVSRYRV